MANNFARLLNDEDKTEHFITKVLNLNPKEFSRVYNKIVTAENNIVASMPYQTLNRTEYRDRRYVDDNKRIALRNRIVHELFTMHLLQNDDDIKLGLGGSYLDNLKKQKQAFIIIGLPASGKSSVATDIATEKGAMILDSDFAKRKLPEYKNYAHGATVVHDESINLIFGFQSGGVRSLYELAVANKYNLVIPKVGNDIDSILRLAQSLKDINYSVHITLVSLTKKQATIRALHRFYSSKRYVPLSMIFDTFSNDPLMTYYMLKNYNFGCIDSYGAISTNVPKGHGYKAIDILGKNPARLYTYDKNNIF